MMDELRRTGRRLGDKREPTPLHVGSWRPTTPSPAADSSAIADDFLDRFLKIEPSPVPDPEALRDGADLSDEALAAPLDMGDMGD